MTCFRHVCGPVVATKTATLATGFAKKLQTCTGWKRKLHSSGEPRHVIVAGSGVAGASVAMHLAQRGAQVTLVDPRPPMTATSQYSTECYRSFFTDAAMVPFMSRSIDLIEALAGDEMSSI